MGAIDKNGREDEYSAHQVKMEGVWMDETEVTNQQFAVFVKATGYQTIAERKPNWVELKKQLPSGTPKPPDDVLVPAVLTSIPKTRQIVTIRWSLAFFFQVIIISLNEMTKYKLRQSDMKYFASIVLLFAVLIAHSQNKTETRSAHIQQDGTNQILLADPTIFKNNGTYYLYGTGGSNGFLVYTSADMKIWKGPLGAKDGYALVKNDAFGSKGFWAPHCFFYRDKFYMFYTANENIAVAKSDSPLGPYRQEVIQSLPSDTRQIDPFLFIDGNKKYLYHVRLDKGNRIFVAEMNDDLSAIKRETLKECISATEPWENTANAPWPVAEGPTVIKHKGNYYLFYSANDFRNIDYAVGYAVAPTPYGPWKKAEGNPIISRHNTGRNGSGHGDLLQNDKGEWFYVLHVHSSSGVPPRVAGIVKLRFIKNGKGPDSVAMEAGSFSDLNLLK
jgi:xylan 1,4-beta-xylosidase